MRTLPPPYTFATDGNYPAGANVWSGQPRVVAPSAAALSAGFTPDTALPAEIANYLQQASGDAASVLAHEALQFVRTDLVVGTSLIDKLSVGPQSVAIGAAADRQKQVLVSGASAGGVGIAQAALLSLGNVAPASYGSLAGSPMRSAPAMDPSGTFFVGINGGGVVTSSDGGASVSSVTVTGLANPADWVGYTANHYLVFDGTAAKMYSCTTLGGTWTSTGALSTLLAVYDIATNGSGTWVISGTAAFGAPKLWTSTDDGVTWAQHGALAATGSVNVVYSARYGLFCALTSSAGTLYTSSDGVTWNLTRTIANLIGTRTQNCFAACGPALVAVSNRGVLATGKYANGLSYSFDLGLTWFETYPGSNLSTGTIKSILSANGRIYATDGSALYQSGLLETPSNPLFVGV